MKPVLWIIPILPLLGAATNGFFGRRFSKRTVALVGTVFVGAAFAMAAWTGARLWHHLPYGERFAFPWIEAGNFAAPFGFYLDQLSLVMTLVVSGVGFVIHIYSVGYMEHEGGYYRFFAYLNLFMFFMLTLVLADNYLLMFVGWEGVGLASYLLIGFFFLKNSAANAGKKAFIVNRIGDFGFLIGLFLLIQHFGSLNFDAVFQAVSKLPPETAAAGLLTAIALLLLVGATGKSAQIPLYVWLPDAMEGPTPVSALIHAATMVTAGVYMVARSAPIFDRAPMALLAVAFIGCLTAIFAATIGIAQTDIKRVLAYSTISQLGYMFLACGVAAYSTAIMHLMTHAFFKALLFLAAGSVIHALGGEQDMRHMGGLRKLIPWTFATMTVGTFTIAGMPFLSGFFSKDEILWKVFSSDALHAVAPPAVNWALWAVALTTAMITSFYMFRLWFMTFFGERRAAVENPHEEAAYGTHPGAAVTHGGHEAGHGVHESPKIMLFALVVLAILSIVGGYVGVPEALGGHNYFDQFLAPVFKTSAEAMPAGEAPAGHVQEAAAEHAEVKTERMLTAASVGAAAIGFLLAFVLYYWRRDLPERIAARLGAVYRTVLNKYYVDEIYNALFVRPVVEGSTRVLWKQIDVGTIDHLVNGAADGARAVSDRARTMQSGYIRSYAAWVAVGAAAVVLYMIWIATR
jgi:NADH-quinone oxidoreductase subunit L